MRLLEINDYFNADFINNPNNQDEISNLAFISNTLYNYEQMYYNKAIRGAFWFYILILRIMDLQMWILMVFN